VVGLLFIATYLPRTKETDSWLAFSVQELVEEVKHQFHPEGANFEASTCYHRLSAEMVTYATALVLGLPEEKREALGSYNHCSIRGFPKLNPAPLPHYSISGTDRMVPFPPWYIERVDRMAEFTMHLTKPNGRIDQIGDNDSGRFLKVGAVYSVISAEGAREQYSNLEGYAGLPDHAEYFDEDHLDHGSLVAGIVSLFGRDTRGDGKESVAIASSLVRSFAKGVRLPSLRTSGEAETARRIRIGDKGEFQNRLREILSLPGTKSLEHEIPVPGGGLLHDLALYAYPDFGVFVYRTKRLFLVIRCGPIGQNGVGGHAHNDQLSIELNVEGEDWISDPGTYLYTPLPQRRDEYRSVKAHFAPRMGSREPGHMDPGLFRLGDEAKGECVYFHEDGFIGMHKGYGIPLNRFVSINEDSISVVESCAGVGPDLDFGIGLTEFRESAPPFSPGYGLRLRAGR